MTATVTLEVITEISGEDEEQIDERTHALIEQIEGLVCGSVTVTNEEVSNG